MKKPRVRWTLRAQQDLLAIGRYIADDNPVAAREWFAKLRAKAHVAASVPMAGRRVPELSRQQLREVLLKSYRIVYRVERGGIAVVTVFEGHRLLERESIEDE